MSIQTQPTWSGGGVDRVGLDRLVDAILPGTAGLPAGREVQDHGELLDRVLQADPQLVVAVVSFAARAAATDHVDLDVLCSWDETHLEQVIFAVTAAYYMSTDVRDRLGYPGQGRRPIAGATADEVCSDELIAPVIARGDVYVPTP